MLENGKLVHLVSKREICCKSWLRHGNISGAGLVIAVLAVFAIMTASIGVGIASQAGDPVIAAAGESLATRTTPISGGQRHDQRLRGGEDE
jgi:hypothetical protein